MRTRAPDLPVAPEPRWRRSTGRTSRTPSVVRWKAVLAPLTPPPMTTTSAVRTMTRIVALHALLTAGPEYRQIAALSREVSHERSHSSRAVEGGRHRRRGRRAAGGAGRRAGHTKARARRRPGRRHLEIRSALQHVVQRHPDIVQPVRQPPVAARRRQAVPVAGHRLEADEPGHVDV